VQRVCHTNEAGPHIKDNIEAVDEALRLVRDLSVDLRPALLDDLGLITALHWYVARYAKRTGLPAEVSIKLKDPNERFSREVETACFRIAQEALTNVVRHAHANRALVRLLKQENVLSLSIEDDGIGFNPEAVRKRAPRAAKLGLLGMQERAHAAGGILEIHSVISKGTEIRLELPLLAEM
jgi:signal transduction histidine kinase